MIYLQEIYFRELNFLDSNFKDELTLLFLLLYILSSLSGLFNGHFVKLMTDFL